ncbi:DUF262 domain-containing protein [Spiroplasma endosymbiont of Cantharis rufa]|uniref:DUF262 domain-containing protein n=1 Tax=Spiroplasma endosymbiont of Cantharis rufa TaxID=3066279 RepID=UPI0030CD3B56
MNKKNQKSLSKEVEKLINFKNNDISLTTFSEFSSLYSSGILNFDHDTQRKKIWDISRATKFIESILQEFPFQPIYISRNKQYYSVIDGKQRLITMLKFSGKFEDEKIQGDDTNIENLFSLDKDILNQELLKLLDAEENEIDYKFLANKFEDFNSIFNNVIFPTYYFDNTDYDEGSEKGVFDVFHRLNSTGIPIENGDIYKSKLFSKENSQLFREDIINACHNFRIAIIGENKNVILNDKEWFYIFKIFWIYKNYDIAITKNFNVKSIEDEIALFISSTDAEEIKELASLVIKANDYFLEIKKEWNKEDSKIKSIFNKNNSNAEPSNSWLNMYPLIMKIIQEESSKPDLTKFKKIKNLINLINEGNEPFIIKNQHGEPKKMKSKFTREPQKISLNLFSIHKFNYNENMTNEEIAVSINNSLL